MRHIRASQRTKRILRLALFFCLFLRLPLLLYAASLPTTVTVTPSNLVARTNAPQNITTTICGSSAVFTIRDIYLLITGPDSKQPFLYATYIRAADKFYLRNDNGSAWIGGYPSRSARIIENSYAKLDCRTSLAINISYKLIINWRVTFKEPLVGAKTIYLYTSDATGINTGWRKVGTASIISSDITAPTGQITINNNNSQYSTKPQIDLTLSAQDNTGGSGMDKMQFSNDNITYSAPEPYNTQKAWQLTQGDGPKTVYAKFSDKANNCSEAYSASTILYTGALINPAAGGEVISADKKARLIIPPDALYEPTQILLMLLDTQALQNAVPKDYTLRMLVDCKPARLIFKKPAQLLITLDETDTPGTTFELGLLDEQTNQIVLMEENAPVRVDGLTLQFAITHFSTYAGLSGMISQGAPIGSGVKIPLPDMLTGAFGHSIPITVPPGRKGMQPNISLQYRSSNPNSWCGLGWSINPGYIVRSTKLGPPLYDDIKDTFIFVTDSGSTELVHLIDNLYQAKIESSFARFFKEPDDTWRIVQKDGSILRFGQSASSREASDAGTFLWNLTKVTDPNGNYIELSHIKDSGKSYLSRIDYTGNDLTNTPPLNTVEFILEDKTDISSNYIFGSEIKTTKRLFEIRVSQHNELVWRYALTYEYSPDTKRSLLKGITQCSSDDKTAFPAQTFKYQ